MISNGSINRTAPKALVRCVLKYSSYIWDPKASHDINASIEPQRESSVVCLWQTVVNLMQGLHAADSRLANPPDL